MAFTDNERDCLIELMNMAYGATSSAVSDTIDAFSTLHIPELMLLKRSQLFDHLNKTLNTDTVYIVSSQQFRGKLEGEVLFILGKDSAINLARHLDDVDVVSDKELADAVMELCNIVTSSTMKNLATNLNSTIDLMPPYEQTIARSEIHNIDGLDKYNNAILLSTVMEFKEQHINGNLMVLCKDDAFNWLKEALNKVINELGY